MENVDALQMQFAITGLINGLIHLIILIASILIVVKNKSVAAILLLIGSLLVSMGFAGGFIYNVLAAQKGPEAIVNAQVTLSFFNAFSFLVFGIGLFLLALNYYKKK
ncbi:hypothetical protein [Gelatiniphilus marinus]|uniref:Uncharacterized protein n=1 Tax=Gelatiniphilus marinus TaxID=1759464 RepID=A0ABW5JQ22_9FLAO